MPEYKILMSFVYTHTIQYTQTVHFYYKGYN
jgi:hypothetical protein